MISFASISIVLLMLASNTVQQNLRIDENSSSKDIQIAFPTKLIRSSSHKNPTYYYTSINQEKISTISTSSLYHYQQPMMINCYNRHP